MHRSKCKGFSSKEQGQWKKELNLNLTPTQIGRKFLFSSQSGACIDTHSYVFIWQCISVHHQIHHHVFSTPDTVAYVSSTEIFKENKNVKIYSWIRLKVSGKKWPVHKLTCGYWKNKRQKIVGSFGFYRRMESNFKSITFIHLSYYYKMQYNMMNWILYLC